MKLWPVAVGVISDEVGWQPMWLIVHAVGYFRGPILLLGHKSARHDADLPSLVKCGVLRQARLVLRYTAN